MNKHLHGDLLSGPGHVFIVPAGLGLLLAEEVNKTMDTHLKSLCALPRHLAVLPNVPAAAGRDDDAETIVFSPPMALPRRFVSMFTR